MIGIKHAMAKCRIELELIPGVPEGIGTWGLFPTKFWQFYKPCSNAMGDSLNPPHTKAELPKVGISFCTQFPSLGIFVNKKVGNRRN